MIKKHYDIIVIGAGINGLLTAAVCSKLGLSIALIDKNNINTDIFLQDKRTSAISWGVSRFLSDFNIWQKLETSNKVSTIDYIYTFEQNQNPVLEFDATALGHPMGYIVENSILKNTILEEIGNVDIYSGHEWTDILCQKDSQFAKIIANNTEFYANLVIACDGKNSGVAKFLKFPAYEYSFGQSALVFTINHELHHNNIAIEEFRPSGPLALLPLHNEGDHHRSGVVWSLEYRQAQYLYNKSKNNPDILIDYLLSTTTRTDYLGKILGLDKAIGLTLYPLNGLILKQRFTYNLICLGDSAHSIHPVAGQGFNMAAYDIKMLYEILKNTIEYGGIIGSYTTLSAISRAGAINHIKTESFATGMVKLFSNNSKIMQYVRNGGLSIFDSNNFLKNKAIHSAMGQIFL